MADMMNIGVQPRHAKLGLAIRARNFTYSAYEVRELRNAFTRIGRTIPVFDGQETAQLMALIAPSLLTLEDAIKAGDPKASLAAYRALTDTCNACHRSLGRDYIAIVPPTRSMFPNQDFSAAKH